MLQRSVLTLSLWTAFVLSPFLLPASMAVGWSQNALRPNQTDEQPPESMSPNYVT
jgi:hypothetical protein